MRKIFQLSVLFAAFLAAFTTPLSAQNIEQEIVDFATNWQATYNRGDHTALAAMYTDEVTGFNPDGTTYTSTKEQIGAGFEIGFKKYVAHTEIKLMRIMAQADGKVAVSGTYSNTDTSIKTGQKTIESGKFEHVAVKEGGVWKLCQMKLIAGN